MNTLLENKTIMVVEDDADTREILRVALEEAGANVVTAHSVEAAFQTYRQSPPHAVIADIRLGTSDGYELIKTIRETDAEYRGVTPVIAVTGFASPEDKQRAIAAGFNFYVTKPFDPADVVAAITKLLSSCYDKAA
jgi:CheY-like chemotaxis protein